MQVCGEIAKRDFLCIPKYKNEKHYSKKYQRHKITGHLQVSCQLKVLTVKIFDKGILRGQVSLCAGIKVDSRSDFVLVLIIAVLVHKTDRWTIRIVAYDMTVATPDQQEAYKTYNRNDRFHFEANILAYK